MKQLITFFGLAYLISWMIWLPLYGEALGLTNLPILPYNHGLGGIGPLISAFLTTWIYPNGHFRYFRLDIKSADRKHIIDLDLQLIQVKYYSLCRISFNCKHRIYSQLCQRKLCELHGNVDSNLVNINHHYL